MGAKAGSLVVPSAHPFRASSVRRRARAIVASPSSRRLAPRAVDEPTATAYATPFRGITPSQAIIRARNAASPSSLLRSGVWLSAMSPGVEVAKMPPRASADNRRLNLSPPTALTIRHVRPEDWDRFKHLWDQYCDFYGASVPLDVTEHLWQRCLREPDGAVFCLVAEQSTQNGGDEGANQTVVGFATGVRHASTFSKADTLYLEDLFVCPSARGKGVATALIEAFKRVVADEGLRKLYWHTLENNAVAQCLYDKLATKTAFIRYDAY